ncbi:F-box domain-containing protein [Mycena chlorophos]|uniref:F-box domain-containing protein n=1 Tax=Mycena chlorophos TaxID=658473 RepID=A0A8H6T923_MYCCL|nr:F-box domain-containing protein [Mycena chlorophos]
MRNSSQTVMSGDAATPTPTVAPQPELSGIHAVPPEILVAILGMSADVEDQTPRTPWDEERRVGGSILLRLARVCSHWRTIVLETPSLWACVRVNSRLWDAARSSTGPKRVDYERLYSRLTQTLHRSANHPLTLHLHADTENSASAVRLLRFLSLSSDRWTEAHLSLASNSSCFLSQAQGRLDQLHTLGIDYACTDDVNPPFDAFAVAPRLHTFQFTGVSKYLPQIPWEQIRNFTCRDYDFSYHWLPLLPLAKLPEGGNCVLDFIVWDARLSSLQAPMECPSGSFSLTLSTLWADEVVRSEDDNRRPAKSPMDIFLDAVSFTNLHTLVLWTITVPPSAVFVKTFERLANRSDSSRSLHRLEMSMGATGFTSAELLSVLLLLPQLQELTAVDPPEALSSQCLITDVLLQGLQSLAICPCLRTLRLTTLGEFAAKTLVALLTARASEQFRFRVEIVLLPEHAVLPLASLYVAADAIEPPVSLVVDAPNM